MEGGRLIAKEGLREISLATIVLAALGAGAGYVWWPLAIPFAIVWGWVLSFFRDPKRVRSYAPGEICSSADGTVTEVTTLDHHDAVGGAAVRIGVFLSLFNVHVNRSPCAGKVRSLFHKPGAYLDARHPESGTRNESNTVLIDPDAPMPGPIEVRQVAGLVARRIICNVKVGEHMPIGYRFGLIKFGSRTEVIIPRRPETQIAVQVGDKVHGGLTILARQPMHMQAGSTPVATAKSQASAAMIAGAKS